MGIPQHFKGSFLLKRQIESAIHRLGNDVRESGLCPLFLLPFCREQPEMLHLDLQVGKRSGAKTPKIL